jgi:hypothetical protein
LRKLAIVAVAITALFAVSAVALAQSSTYSVTASTSPAKPGTKSKPVPIALKFGISAAGVTGRPASSKTFKVGFSGLHSNGKAFKTCSAASINAIQSDKNCTAAAKVGSGTVHNLAGATGDLTDTSITCDLKVTFYNAGANRAAIYLQGGPGIAGASCPIAISQALDAKFVSFSGGGQALQFDIPSNLIHPIGGIDNAIITIDFSISKKTAKVGKKTVGYFEAVGGCKAHKRAIALTLTSEAGATSNSSASAKC